MGHAIFIFGPAGSGKSTFCRSLVEHGKVLHRQFNLVNFDPAQISEKDEYLLDIRDYITTAEIMEECDYGPNGSLMVAFEELYKNIEVLEIEEYVDEYLIFDCPGQIELFMHSNVLNDIVTHISKYFKCGILYFIESQSILDTGKFMGNLLCAYISMSRYNVFMSFVLSKVDLTGKDAIQDFLVNLEEYCEDNKLYTRILEVADLDFKMLDYSDDESVNDLLYWIDNNLQYYDDVDTQQERDQD